MMSSKLVKRKVSLDGIILDDCMPESKRVKREPVEIPHTPTSTRAQSKTPTFLQSAKQKNVPVRFGKWNKDEDAYLFKLVEVFHRGIVDNLPQKHSLRKWLADMLNCCKMRISKKQSSEKNFHGNVRYQRNEESIARLTQREHNEISSELQRLRTNFLERWAVEEARRNTSSSQAVEFEQWYYKAKRSLPRVHIAKNERIQEQFKEDAAISFPSAADIRRKADAASQLTSFINDIKPPQSTSSSCDPSKQEWCSVEISPAPLEPLLFQGTHNQDDCASFFFNSNYTAPLADMYPPSGANYCYSPACHLFNMSHRLRNQNLYAEEPKDFMETPSAQVDIQPDTTVGQDNDLLGEVFMFSEPAMLAWGDTPTHPSVHQSSRTIQSSLPPYY